MGQNAGAGAVSAVWPGSISSNAQSQHVFFGPEIPEHSRKNSTWSKTLSRFRICNMCQLPGITSQIARAGKCTRACHSSNFDSIFEFSIKLLARILKHAIKVAIFFAFASTHFPNFSFKIHARGFGFKTLRQVLWNNKSQVGGFPAWCNIQDIQNEASFIIIAQLRVSVTELRPVIYRTNTSGFREIYALWKA